MQSPVGGSGAELGMRSYVQQGAALTSEAGELGDSQEGIRPRSEGCSAGTTPPSSPCSF